MSKNHFAKLFVDVDNHPRTAALWGRPFDRAVYTELLRLAVARQVNRHGDVLELRSSDAQQVMGYDRGRSAFRSLDAFLERVLVDAQGYAAIYGGDPEPVVDLLGWSGRRAPRIAGLYARSVPRIGPLKGPTMRALGIRKFAKNHGFALENATARSKSKEVRGEERDSPPPRQPEQPSLEGIGPPSLAETIPQAAAVLDADALGFDSAFFHDLAVTQPQGRRVEPAVAMAWLVRKWPDIRDHMAAEGQTKPRRCVRNWWANTDDRDLERAREYLDGQRWQARESRAVEAVRARSEPEAGEPEGLSVEAIAERLRVVR